MSTASSGLSAIFPTGPKTPEPTSAALPIPSDDARPPSPPRPRLRLKRRAVSRLSAPTQNFLASVAAADVPIPSIEEPEDSGTLPELLRFQQQLPPRQCDDVDGNLLSVRGRNAFSPPKTPAPGALPSISPSRYPNWSLDSVFSSSTESSPDPECGSSSRPSTARSTQTSSSSLFSRFSQLSDDEHCVSPEEDSFGKSKFGNASPLEALRRNSAHNSAFSNIADRINSNSSSNPNHPALPTANQDRRSRRKAPWTKAMSSHLWATYILYLQDPKVTPFRVGKSCVPPHGVCLRVAREAKRSWKGAKALAKASAGNAEPAAAPLLSVPVTVLPGQAPPIASNVASNIGVAQANDAANKSGSSTPTAADGNASGTYMEWPHTNAATRAHLREMCRLRAATPGGGARGLQYMSRSPTPFTQPAVARFRNLRATPGYSAAPSSFATRDMALSLSLSTSEAMQPQGPLAQLTRFGPDSARRSNVASNLGQNATTATAENAAPSTTADAFSGRLTSAIEAEEPSFAERRRLGSPFAAQSYGPSSSSSLAAVLGLSTLNSRQPHTVGPRRTLQSPVRLSRSGTQKRRTKHLSQEMRKRPGLASDFFTEPSAEADGGVFAVHPAVPADYGMGGSSTGSTHHHGRFVSRAEATSTLTSSFSAPELTAPSSSAPAADMELPATADNGLEPAPAPLRVLDGLGASDFADVVLPLHAPARLGSPFSSIPASNSSFSFPNRLSQPPDFDLASLDRPFATVQRIAQPKAVSARTNLASRLAYIDQRLRELNNRNDNRRRRSDSPF
ncbi:hypothetical protein SPI_04127 [Niveomyces insectorum RCEF 264]|uniref:Uncharacterized protein n=1 Tax=Niveomyces insectorum RCEF 264 TaxID=1081102 RepID=A0A167VGH4_9HYPO|nr:hypothetical protein SPI_04127 [Niveomyces insectorum RCEF 264]